MYQLLPTLAVLAQAQRDRVAEPGGQLRDAVLRDGVRRDGDLRHELQRLDAPGPPQVAGALLAVRGFESDVPHCDQILCIVSWIWSRCSQLYDDSA